MINKGKNKKTELEKAKIELVIFLVFIAFVFAYSKILVARNHNIKDNTDIIDIKSSISLNEIKKYDFSIKISVTQDNIKNEYVYSGNIDNENGNITYNNNKYIILNEEFYDKDYNKVDNMFYNIDNKYLYLDNIKSYLIDDNLVNNQYQIKLNEIINQKFEEVYIYIERQEVENKIILNIDYTNLVKLQNDNITSYIIEYQIYNFV